MDARNSASIQWSHSVKNVFLLQRPSARLLFIHGYSHRIAAVGWDSRDPFKYRTGEMVAPRIHSQLISIWFYLHNLSFIFFCSKKENECNVIPSSKHPQDELFSMLTEQTKKTDLSGFSSKRRLCFALIFDILFAEVMNKFSQTSPPLSADSWSLLKYISQHENHLQ